MKRYKITGKNLAEGSGFGSKNVPKIGAWESLKKLVKSRLGEKKGGQSRGREGGVLLLLAKDSYHAVPKQGFSS